MAQRKNLLTIDYHYDDDSGMYQIGEIDTGISSNLEKYIECFGEKGVKEILSGLAYLAGEVSGALREYNRKVDQATYSNSRGCGAMQNVIN